MYQQQYQQGGGYYPPQNHGGYGQPQNQNVYVGTGKCQQGQYGLMWTLSFNAEDLQKLQSFLNENGWVTINLRERQQPSPTGATHYGVIRQWQPQGQGQIQNLYTPPQQGGQYRQAPRGQYQQQRPRQQGQYRPPQNYGTPPPVQSSPPPPPQQTAYSSTPAPLPNEHIYSQADCDPNLEEPLPIEQ